MTFIKKLQNFWHSFLVLIGLRQEAEEHIPASEPVFSEDIPGTSGHITPQAVLVKLEKRIILSLDVDLGDMPSWIEWDKETNIFSLAQNGGAVAHFPSPVPKRLEMDLKETRSLMLISTVNGQRLSHLIPFVERDHDTQ